MKAIGFLTTVVLAGLGAIGAVIAVTSLPDIQRYLRIREM